MQREAFGCKRGVVVGCNGLQAVIFDIRRAVPVGGVTDSVGEIEELARFKALGLVMKADFHRAFRDENEAGIYFPRAEIEEMRVGERGIRSVEFRHTKFFLIGKNSGHKNRLISILLKKTAE